MMGMRHLAATLAVVLTSVGLVAFAAFLDGRPRVQQSVVDLGRMLRGHAAVASFFVHNDGFRTISIVDIKPDCATYTGVTIGTILKPGESTLVPVTLITSRLREGESYSTVVLRTSSWFRPTVTLVARTDIASEFSLSARHLQFPPGGGPAELVISTTNVSTAIPTTVVSTNPDIRASLLAVGDGSQRRFRVKAEWRLSGSPVWDLGNLVIHTTSAASPEVRIPVRRGRAD